jgi:hypothetical protein
MVLAGCSGGNVATHTMNKGQATTRAKQILEDTAAALHPRPTLELYMPMSQPTQCLADIPDADKMVNVGYTYILRGFPESENGSIGRQILAYWKKQGYTIQTSGGFNKGQPGISGETKDAYLISLDWRSDGSLGIGTTSPCIYPDGTPPS